MSLTKISEVNLESAGLSISPRKKKGSITLEFSFISLLIFFNSESKSFQLHTCILVCKNLPKITVTHDPAGAFHPKIAGLVISGHTHCGQISFPYVGPIWIPSEVPREAHCGLYKDNYYVDVYDRIYESFQKNYFY